MQIRYIDLFAGIGGFRIAAEQVFSRHDVKSQCVFSCEIDPFAQKAYQANFGDLPASDVTEIDAHLVPDHDLLFAGFPCQPFSIIGNGNGFKDVRGTLFFDIARILEAKRPKAFVLENVKRLVNHKEGYTFGKILQTLRRDLDYWADYKVLNALDYGLPQKRERVFIVGFHKSLTAFPWPEKAAKRKPLSRILEKTFDPKHLASDNIRKKRLARHTPKYTPSIWHENKSGNISSYPYSCALRAGASYNYLLVDGERRLTPREMLRLQGFPDSFKIVVPDGQVRKQAGNAVPVDVVKAVLESFLPILLSDTQAQQLPTERDNNNHAKAIYAGEKIPAAANG